MTIRIFNVLGREKQDFVPIVEGRVGMYVCGPTIYDHAHLGHAKTYVSFDVIVRYLRQFYDVVYVQNLTDVGHLLETGEDRILRKARQLQTKPMQIADYYGRSYNEDMRLLGVQPPDIQPRASGHVPEQIEMTQELIKAGYAYEVNGSVYFDVMKDDDYGKLSNRRVEKQQEDTRGTIGMSDKRHPADFALAPRRGQHRVGDRGWRGAVDRVVEDHPPHRVRGTRQPPRGSSPARRRPLHPRHPRPRVAQRMVTTLMRSMPWTGSDSVKVTVPGSIA